MAENKKSFILYTDNKSIVNMLSNEDAGLLLKTLYAYCNDENPIIDNSIKIVFEMFKLQLKRDLKKWENTKEVRSIAGKASAEARRLAKENQQTSTNSTNVNFVQQTSTNSTVNVNVNDNVNITTYKAKYEEFKNECLIPSEWNETVCMREKIPLDKLQYALEDFNGHLISTDENHKYIKDYKYHFVMWVKKRKQLKAKEETNINTGKL